MQNLFIYRVLVNLSKNIKISHDQLQVKKAIILAGLSGTSNGQLQRFVASQRNVLLSTMQILLAGFFNAHGKEVLKVQPFELGTLALGASTC